MSDHDSPPEDLERSAPEHPQLVTDPESRLLVPPLGADGQDQVATNTRDYLPSAIALAAPPMTDAEYRALRNDIRAHGLRVPIVLIHGDADDEILDGVHRQKACIETGRERRYLHWESSHPGDSPIAFAVSQHTHRHPTIDQRAIYAARLATLDRGRPGENAPAGALSQSDAASMMGVSRRSVQRARVVVDAGIDELTDLVATGKLSLGAAEKFAKFPENPAFHTTREDKTLFAKSGAQAVRQHLKTLDEKRDALSRLAAVGQMGFLPRLTPEEQAVQDAAVEAIFHDHPIERAAVKFQSRQNHNMAIIAAHVAKINDMLRILPGLSHEHARILGQAWQMGYEKVKKKLGNELTTNAQLRIDQLVS